jgi:hypothetical protein
MQQAKKACDLVAGTGLTETPDGFPSSLAWRIDTSPLFSAIYWLFR